MEIKKFQIVKDIIFLNYWKKNFNHKMKDIQLFQSSHNALQLPYAFIGLGRTNNYVENFYIGMPQNVLIEFLKFLN